MDIKLCLMLGVPYLEVHDVTFGGDPHVPHVIFREQQQPLASDVIFLKQVSVQLRFTRALA